MGYVGSQFSADKNTVTVSGTGSLWRTSVLHVGSYGAGNNLTITNGGQVVDGNGYVGTEDGASNNVVTVTGIGSVWSNSNFLYVGSVGDANSLTIINSGQVINIDGYVGYDYRANNNAVTVSGSGSVWHNNGTLAIGYGGTGGSLTITNNGAVTVAGNAYISYNVSASNNIIIIDGGSLTVTNAAATGALTVRRGTLRLNSGTVTVDALIANNIGAIVQFNGGVLNTRSSVVANAFVVGNGTDSATLNLLGGGQIFGNGLVITNNAWLTGTGTISGSVLVNGSVQADTGSGLTFNGAITNNAVLRASNGAVIESWGPVVNNGVIDIIYGNTNFHSTFVNNGIVLTADGDPDGDGMTNLQESQAGTSPTNSVSCLRVTGVTSTSNDVCITWTAVGGKSYVVQTNSTPGSGFADFSPVIYVTGFGESVTNYVHTGGATNSSALFYRVRLGP